jgi:hypothetical protein
MTFYAGALSRDAEFKQSLLKDPLYTKCQQLSSNYKPEEISIQKTENKEKWIAYNCKKKLLTQKVIQLNQLTYLLSSCFYDDCDVKTCPVRESQTHTNRS